MERERRQMGGRRRPGMKGKRSVTVKQKLEGGGGAEEVRTERRTGAKG